VFISLEGLDGSGKTTQFHRLVDWLRARGCDVLALREPGGTPIGEQVRELLHDHKYIDMDARTELLLYCASRAQLVAQRIKPHLAAGGVVLTDRFVDSTLAYQGFGRGLDLNFLHTLLNFATHGLTPTATLYFDVPVEVGLARRSRGGEWNRLDAESLAFHQRVGAGYKALIAADSQRWLILDATKPIDSVTEAMLKLVARKLKLQE
jgi:dTMP kinase